MSGLDLLESKREVIAEICLRFDVIRLDVFGSATSEEFNPESSDFDFIVEYAPGTDLGPWLSRFTEFQEALAAALGRKVDVVMAGAVKRPGFAREVERTRRTLYAA